MSYNIKTVAICLFSILIFVSSKAFSQVALQIKIGVYQSTYDAIDEKKTINSHLVEKALSSSGLKDYEVQITPYYGFKELLQAVREGEVLIAAEPFWRLDVLMNHKTTILSVPILGYKEYVAHLYTSQKLFSRSSSYDDISQLTMVGSPVNMGLWSILHELNPAEFYLESDLDKQIELVRTGSIDAVLLPIEFTKSITPKGLELLTEDVFSVRSTQHFLVSRIHPDSRVVNAALNLGLLRQKQVD